MSVEQTTQAIWTCDRCKRRIAGRPNDLTEPREWGSVQFSNSTDIRPPMFPGATLCPQCLTAGLAWLGNK